MAIEDDYESVRDWLKICLERDLIGPGWKEGTQSPNHHERLDVGGSGAPNRFYLTGMLAPQEGAIITPGEIPPEQAGEKSSVSEGGGTGIEKNDPVDESVAEVNSWSEAGAMGLTLRPVELNNSIKLVVSWGEYTSERDSEGRIWKRMPFEFKFEFTPEDVIHGESLDIDFPDEEAQGVRLLVERSGPDQSPLMTIRLANMRSSGSGQYPSKAAATLYQVRIEVDGEFYDARTKSPQNDALMDLLYRHSKVYARGHMVAVDWNKEGTRIWTSYLARHLVPEMVFKDSLGELLPNIERLADASNVQDGLNQLLEFINAFEQWG